MKRSHEVLAVLAITLVALALRLYHIDFQCLTWDEGFTKNLALSNTSTIFSFSFLLDCNPPLYYLTSHYMIQWFNDSAFILRLPAAIASTLAIPVVYLLGKEYKDELLGIFMAATVAISYPMIFYGQFARPYSYVFLAFAIATYAFIKIFRDEHWKWYLLFTVAGTFSMWSHAYAFVPLSMMWVYLLWEKIGVAAKWLVLLLLWCSPFLYYIQMVFTRSGEHFGGTWWQILTMLPLELFWVPAVVILPMFAWVLIKNREGLLIKPELYLGVVAAVTILSTLPISFLNPVFPRYAMLVVPIVLALALSPMVEYIQGYRQADQKVALSSLWFFFVFACSYTPLIAWYFITDCPYK